MYKPRLYPSDPRNQKVGEQPSGSAKVEEKAKKWTEKYAIE